MIGFSSCSRARPLIRPVKQLHMLGEMLHQIPTLHISCDGSFTERVSQRTSQSTRRSQYPTSMVLLGWLASQDECFDYLTNNPISSLFANSRQSHATKATRQSNMFLQLNGAPRHQRAYTSTIPPKTKCLEASATLFSLSIIPPSSLQQW